jgi:hypothetical protein
VGLTTTAINSDQNNEARSTDEHFKHYLRTIASVEPEGIMPSLNQSFGKATELS